MSTYVASWSQEDIHLGPTKLVHTLSCIFIYLFSISAFIPHQNI